MQEFNQENQIENNPPEMKVEKPIGLEKPSPNNPPWNSFFAFLLWFTSVGLIVVLPSLFIMPYLISKNIQLSDNSELKTFLLGDPTAVIISLGGTILAHFLTIVFAWIIVTKFKTYSFTEMLGWRWGGFKIWHGFVILVSVFALAITLVNLLGSQDNDMSKILASSRTAVFMVAFLATFSAPFVEEVVYRGVLYSAFQRTFGTPISKLLMFLQYFKLFRIVFGKLRKIEFFSKFKNIIESFQKKYHIPLAVIFITLIFAGVHVPQYLPDYAAIISVCFLSLIITLVRAKTDNLLPCIVIHMVFNGIQSVLLILEPYLPLPESLNTVPEKTSLIIHLLTYISYI